MSRGVIKFAKPVRVVVPLRSETHLFVAATCSTSSPNAFHFFDFDEETNEVTVLNEVAHEGEVWTCAAKKDLLCAGGPRTLRIYRIDGTDLEEIKSLEQSIKQIVWGQYGEVAAMSKHEVSLYDQELQLQSTLKVGDRAHALGFDPHHTQRLCTLDDTTLKLWDVRSGDVSGECECHTGAALSLDFNPNVPYQLITSGEDARLRLWDVRKLTECIQELADGHRHWITKVAFNHVHDQLVLSASTDSTLNLWRIGSVTSRPLGSTETERPDGVVRTIEHEEAIYSTAWGLADSWVFASASYDGTIMVNQVPPEEKYRLLL